MIRTALPLTAACLALTAGSRHAVGDVVASDNFDSPLNLISYSAIDAEGNDPTNTGVWASSRDNFGPRTMADRLGGSPSGNFLSETIADLTGGEDVFDNIGILEPSYPDGAFFAICDTDNGANPTGDVTGTWVFDISAADALTGFSVDMAQIGNWFDNGSGFFEFVEFSYSIDGGADTTLITLRGDQSLGVVSYTLADGFTVVTSQTFVSPEFVAVEGWGASVNGVALLNQMTTLTAPMAGKGCELTIEVRARINGNETGVVFDNMIIEGTLGVGSDCDAPPNPACTTADFNDDGDADVFDVFDLLDALDECNN